MSKYDFSYNKPLNENYKNILVLDKELTEHGIPHELVRNWDGWMICYPDIPNRIGDVTTNDNSYGHSKDLMEAYMFPECNGDIIPDLTVEDAFKLFENAHANVTKTVKKDNACTQNVTSDDAFDIVTRKSNNDEFAAMIDVCNARRAYTNSINI